MRRLEPCGRVTMHLPDTVARGTLRAIPREGGVDVQESMEALA